MGNNQEWNHTFIEANGHNFHCVIEGEGEPVILCHGFPECWYSWRHQIRSLSKRFKVIAPDMRGFGLSDKPKGVKSYMLQDVADDIKGIIEALGYQKASVVGHDWGGAVAWMVAIKYPENVEKLVILDAPHPSGFINTLLSSPLQLMRSSYMAFFNLPVIPELLFSSFNYLPLKMAFKYSTFRRGAFSPEDLEILAGEAARPGALTGGLNYYRALFRNFELIKNRSNLPNVKCPTLVIWAELDLFLGKELTYDLDGYVDNKLTREYVPHCNHWIQQEQPRVVNRLINTFL
ncbi:MAG: alpha/beta hydrolase [Actinobacteria bacterium]|nr:alpha/beta hydrolase [Actinomycetota bacterium]